MAFIFTLIGSGRQNGPVTGEPESSPQDTNGRLEVIMEHGDGPPLTPEAVKTSHRPFTRRYQHGNPPPFRQGSPPPPYSVYGGILGPNGEKLSDMRNNKYIAKRGGWKRLCAVALVLVIVIVGLAVGLAVGLKKKPSSAAVASSTSAPAASPSSAPTGPFPIGSYSLPTFLDSVSTNCTSDPATWLCYPYSTYNQSRANSGATFDWIINPSSGTPSSGANFTISSTNNPFSLTFSNVPLEMLDTGLSSERYRFQVPMDKVVVPTTPITSDGSISNCWYNGTTLQADLYTSMTKSYPPASSPSSTAAAPGTASSGAGAAAFKPWPYAVQVEQVIAGGQNVPQCFEMDNGNTGPRITTGLDPMAAGDLCSCLYKNWDP